MVLDVVLAVLFGVAAIHDARISAVGLLPAAAGPCVAAGAAIALLGRRRWPISVLALTVLAQMLVGATWPMLPALFTVADRYGNRRRTWWAAAGALAVAAVPWGPAWSITWMIDHAPFDLALPTAALLLGLSLHQRRQLITGLRERAEQAERERDLRAAAAVEAERLHIARELHDIVAHRISQITVLAGALEVSAHGQVAESAAVIRRTGAQALNEMRDMLGVLRWNSHSGGSEQAALRPAPDLSAIVELVDAAVAAGQRVDVLVPPELPAVTGPVARAAYRLVQESLTNAAKHAAGAAVRISLTVHDNDFEVDVRNGPGDRSPIAAHGSGFGLAGMCERVELAGGTLHSAPLATGGFRVHARFPMADVDQRRTETV